MPGARSDTPSVTDRVRPVEAGAPVAAVHFLGEMPVFVLGEEALLFADAARARRIAVHAGGILASDGDGARIVTGGDDGKVVVIGATGEPQVVATDAKQRWIDHVALGPDDAVAWSAGKTAYVRTGKSAKTLGEDKSLDVPSTVGGLGFAPKGFRLAVSHYNGVLLWFPNAQAAPEKFEWKGSHHKVAFSPDGRFLMTAMQEPTMHGWRVVDRKDLRMSGYSARVRSFGWTAGGKFLATSGSEQVILWPFEGKDGPMGARPKMLAPHGARVVMVAGHPRQPVVAAGYADGMVLLVKIDDGAEILARRPAGAPVTALAWDAAGRQLAFGDDNGAAGIVAL